MKLSWNDAGKRFYKTGIDRCVLFTKEGGVYQSGVAWNGVTKADTQLGGHDRTDLFTGDRRSAMLFTPYTFGGSISAFSYPDEFDPCIGNNHVGDGLVVAALDQIPFAICYRRLLGNDTEGNKFGYELHFVYDAVITGIKDTAETIGEQANPAEMGFDFECVGEEGFEGNGPVAHLVVSTKIVDSDHMASLESVIYGTDDSDPRLPLPEEIRAILHEYLGPQP